MFCSFACKKSSDSEKTAGSDLDHASQLLCSRKAGQQLHDKASAKTLPLRSALSLLPSFVELPSEADEEEVILIFPKTVTTSYPLPPAVLDIHEIPRHHSWFNGS